MKTEITEYRCMDRTKLFLLHVTDKNMKIVQTLF
jgi:hypothetical protein